MTEEVLQLGYRELADRLSISPDAARMKAKRAAKSGRWRIIPGNHPSDRVLVEIPAADLNAPERVGGEHPERVGKRTEGRTPDRTEADAITGQMVAALQSAQDRIRELTDQLTEEKDRHRETAMGLVQAETVQANAALEIDRLQVTIAELQADLQAARRSWWQRLTGR
ncbi:hypothetical protein HHL26_23905 [Sphingobium sp. TB-6]|uniref:hypothetical protein n=1 Tax=Sphingobium sp. TB-6 TaxID=2728850 RepID=UPI00146EF41B|nr:hypothetical protein [Sphingobium sp. TB-6]NML92043.1 hypothetical protein [Sphingobium sp. TB-6]